ncbi:hypothetical protein PSACC_00217 [Paramicrosporidium saccamoebae]|uniref:Uncharacterized protein n=1 Tax=Paramicrosporidium saccamoebae TaxID=1246581 RepID=A0A2H9TP16_9FUNG|nr:hypothetical protein PSACC_00701 [Paramicrosporidium saccamoebae]PJF19969.1 hypothetical protein PSACC_00217 [Paramicrosporidium saccamoebae]
MSDWSQSCSKTIFAIYKCPLSTRRMGYISQLGAPTDSVDYFTKDKCPLCHRDTNLSGPINKSSIGLFLPERATGGLNLEKKFFRGTEVSLSILPNHSVGYRTNMTGISPFLTARALLLFYIITALLLPLGGLASVPTTPTAAPPAADLPTKEPEGETQQKERRGDYLYLNFPDEGPEAALLADMLSRIAVRTLLEPIVRPASSAEVIDTLTYSVYTTMMILGSLVFGVGIIVLSWKVYLSVREAAVSEPITFSFLFTIPGLRYLNNHARYHLFDMPLQPRRRFASFVGASGSNLDFLGTEDEAIAAIRGKSELGSPLGGGKGRRKSVMKPNAVVSAVAKQVDFRKRHSMVSLHTPPPSHAPSDTPSPVPEATRPRAVVEKPCEKVYVKPVEDEEIASPVPMNVCIVPQFSSPDDAECSSQHSSIDNADQIEQDREWTPVSAEESEGELNRKRADWVRSMSLFTSAHSPYETPEPEPQQEHVVIESKLSRRLHNSSPVEQLGGGLEQSKLLRYFAVPTDIPTSNQACPSPQMDATTQKLHDGDLTPPPGFTRRHSTYQSASASVSSSSLLRQFALDPMLEEDEDTVTPAPGYHAAFVSAAQRRRASVIPPLLRLPTEGSSEQWRWFMGTDGSQDSNESLWDPPTRPHSTELSRGHLAPVGSGSRSLGRMTPEATLAAPKKKGPSNISLGIFDDMFPRN